MKETFFQKHFKPIALTGVVLIPTIYTTIFLGSMWDPYGNLDSLPVAVVNNDVSVEYEGSNLDIGSELVDKLEENDSLDFNFVDAETAEAGLEDGTYYMTITIPSDFSANAATLMDDEPQKMQLSYKTNPGTNYIASKMSESALAKIQKEISATVTETYSETIFDQLSDIGTGFQDASDGAGKISDGAAQLIEGNTTITDNLQLLADSTVTFEDGASELGDGLVTYTDGVASVDSGAKTLADGMAQLSDGTASLSDGATQLEDGSKSLSDGVSSYTDGVSTANAGAQKLSENSDALISGASALSDGAAQLESGSEALTAGLQTLSSTLDSSLSADSVTQIQQVSAGLTQLQQGIDTLNTTLQATETPDTSALVTTLTQSLTAIGASAQDAGTQLTTLQTAVTSLASSAAFQSLDATTQQQLMASFTAPLQSLATDISSIGNTVTALSTTLQNTDLSSSASSMETLKTSVNTLTAGADQVLPGAKTAISSLSGGLTNVQSAVDTQILPGAQSINSGLISLNSGANSLESGVSEYTSGVSQLQNGLETLDSNSATLVKGASDLNSGISTLSASIPTLTDAVQQLKDGSAELSDGTAQLASNSDALVSGATQLTDGASQIQDGAQKLTDGSAELGDGLVTLSDGSDTLQSSLADGAEEVNDVNATDSTYEMFASPVESQETYLTTVDANGDAMAAYMMCVGLWVAGLAFCIMLNPNKQRLQGKVTAFAWSEQLVKLWLIAIIQALIMIFCLCLFNGFEADNMLRVAVIACLASIAFVTLEYTVNFFLGIVGSFVLLVFMVLQLAGCAGTYPLELSGSFYHVLNPFMPFTYVVHGFRSGIASDLSVTTDIIVLCGITIAFAIMLYFGFKHRMKKQVEEAVEEESAQVEPQKIPAHAM